MLETLKIIALVQGFFVLAVLYANRKEYKKTTYWLLIGTLFSVLLYILADDGSNLFLANADWFLFDKSLFVTFLFLFFKYDRSALEKFSTKDFFYFIPNFIYVLLELFELYISEFNIVVESLEIAVEFIFTGYLIAILIPLFTRKIKHWIVYFVIPIAILFVFSFVNDIIQILGFAELPLFKDKNFNTYLLLIVAFLFYFIAFKLLTKSKEILAKKEISKYQNSILDDNQKNKIKQDLIQAMEKDQLFLNGKLSIQDVANNLNIPRQYISEVLNEHVGSPFSVRLKSSNFI
ncbi:AraC family transcriptional regulator [Frigoriflavimonas asaccharolytica]|uniref:HTH araC/xylS-type domain-containing protein n=1 Tax=Frigoriflavimonas asaccharolytica TaxID=2735899 RepID=A0A8J8K6S1_9FLAO|nr:AraC family transcriptional regulator [Frigoriflavimonas asaccharolytica]NRS94050.1 hypothetical protein [Frigoriflavimonas asaccharolytica]